MIPPRAKAEARQARTDATVLASHLDEEAHRLRLSAGAPGLTRYLHFGRRYAFPFLKTYPSVLSARFCSTTSA
jgi:hypothetical protein